MLAFNPLKLANSPMTPKTKVLVKSMEKTTRMLLIHLHKRYQPLRSPDARPTFLMMSRDPNNPMAGRTQQQIERLMRSRAEIFDEANRKRAFAQPVAAEYGDAKRQKVDGAAAPGHAQPIAPGPQSLAATYTLTTNPGLRGFDASLVPVALAARIVVKALVSVPQPVLDQAIFVRLTL